MDKNNPFKYGSVVTGVDFCERPNLIKDLVTHINSGQNLVIEGERRTGKTSAIMQAVKSIKKLKPIYVDLLFISSVEDLYRRVLTGLVVFESQTGFIQKIFSTLTHLKPNMSLDPISGLPSFSFETSSKNVPQSIAGLVGMIEEISHKEKVCVIFDEFQSILGLDDAPKVLAALRSQIQFQSHVPYIFAGSVKHQMSDLFHSPKSAFFKAAIPIQVGEIDTKIFGQFIEKKFKKGKRLVEKELVQEIQNIANGNPGDIQQLNAAIWDISDQGSHLERGILQEAIKLIHRREEKGYEQVIEVLTSLQKKCLFALARHPEVAPLSKKFTKLSGVELPSTIARSLKRLIKLHVLLKRKNQYRFVNPFLRYWILNKGL